MLIYNNITSKIFTSIIILLIGCSTFSQAQTQQAYIDNLKYALDTTKTPYQKAELLNKLAAVHYTLDNTLAIDYAKKALDILPQEYQKEKGYIYNTIANLYGHIGAISDAKKYLDSAILLYTKMDSEEGLAMSYANLGSVYTKENNYEQALKYTYKSLAINDKLKRSKIVATNLTTLSRIHFAQKEYQKALEHWQRALTIYEENKPNIDIPITLTNIGAVYKEINKLDSALYYLKSALASYQDIDNQEGIAVVYDMLGGIYQIQGDVENALVYLEKAEQLLEQINALERKVLIYSSLGGIYDQKGDYKKSVNYYTKALLLCDNTEFKEVKSLVIRGLSDAYGHLGDFKNAYSYQSLLLELRDSILDEKKQKQIKELEIKYETDKKEQENLLLAQERDLEKIKASRSQQLMYGAIIVLLLVWLTSYLLIRQNKIKAAQQTTELKHKLLRNQMNPHFIFNSLIAIQSFVYKNEPRQAGKYLSSFAKLVRAILENSRKEYITLSKEIQWLENYLSLQLLRFDNKFEYEINIEKDLDVDATLIPPMLTQPFIENALEHGIKDINYLGKVKISFEMLDGMLQIKVQDNGIGLKDNTQETPNGHVSLATSITKERLDFLNKKSNKKIYFEINNMTTSGTLVLFSIPLKKVD